MQLVKALSIVCLFQFDIHPQNFILHARKIARMIRRNPAETKGFRGQKAKGARQGKFGDDFIPARGDQGGSGVQNRLPRVQFVENRPRAEFGLAMHAGKGGVRRLGLDGARRDGRAGDG